MSELLRQELQIIVQPGRTYYIPIPEEDSGFKIQNLNERPQDLKEKRIVGSGENIISHLF